MNKLAIVLLAIAALLSGCVVYETPYRDDSVVRYGDRDRDRDGVPNRVDRDRDGDGVPNRRDSRPNNPRSY